MMRTNVFVALSLVAACQHTEPRWPTSLPASPGSGVSATSAPDAGVRIEVAALRAYDRLLDSDEWNAGRALDIVQRYPDTYAASMLAGRITKTAEAAARTDLTLQDVVAFLDGEPIPVPLQFASVGLDQSRFRMRYEVQLRDELGDRLGEDGCETLMAYCTWWVDRYPHAPQTQQIAERMDAVWSRRIRPGWKGRRHHRCAWNCGTTCRARVEPLDDSCYGPCYETCL